MEKEFVFLEHPADIKFKAFGKDLDEVFENTSKAISSYLSPDKKVESNKSKIVHLQAPDFESLLYNFVDEILYLLDADKFVVSKAKVKIEKNRLEARIFGDDSKNYEIKQIKAATYADMYIKEATDKTWECQMVLDV
jgi:SHS2 domain-containing protein